jgi:hypothetical protein
LCKRKRKDTGTWENIDGGKRTMGRMGSFSSEKRETGITIEQLGQETGK